MIVYVCIFVATLTTNNLADLYGTLSFASPTPIFSRFFLHLAGNLGLRLHLTFIFRKMCPQVTFFKNSFFTPIYRYSSLRQLVTKVSSWVKTARPIPIHA